MRYQTQKMRLLHYLLTHPSISDKEAADRLSIRRLAARVHDLRRDGYKIESSYVSGLNGYGERVRFVRYKLIWDNVEQHDVVLRKFSGRHGTQL